MIRRKFCSGTVGMFPQITSMYYSNQKRKNHSESRQHYLKAQDQEGQMEKGKRTWWSHLTIAIVESHEVSTSVPSHSPHTVTCSSWAESFEDVQKNKSFLFKYSSVYVTPTGKEINRLVCQLIPNIPKKLNNFIKVSHLFASKTGNSLIPLFLIPILFLNDCIIIQIISFCILN